MSQLSLPIATASEIPIITRLAQIIWHQHYPSIISSEQINYMLNLMYNQESLLEQMSVKGHIFHLVLQNNNVIGFVSLCRIKDSDWFINKYYIDQTYAGQGVGSISFKQLVNLYNPTTIKLTVNRQNFKSINFYFKNGFVIESVEDFDIGNGFIMNDFVMVWKKQ